MRNKNKFKNYSSKYFIDAMKILDGSNNSCTLNFFSFQDNYVLCGINEVRKIIYESLPKDVLKKIKIYSREDGEILKSKEPCLLIKGDYSKFAFLENIIDGILSRMSSVATNVKKIVNETKIPIIFMADRSDIYINQKYDGYAAYISGINMFVTKEMMELLPKDAKYIGTIPHSLIQQNKGDIVETLKLYIKKTGQKSTVALIDYNNDCEKEIQKISKSDIKNNIWAVRIDTSSSLIDKGLKRRKINEYGVNTKLIKLVRETLDKNEMNDVKIIVTSGMNIEKIKRFNKENAPIDMYGIGSSFIERSVFFTGDLVEINGELEAKFGRKIDLERYINKMVEW